ncbi:molybdenum cofactor guanylyltransferase MobA [Cognatishimia sp. F0-27]|uniref:molybdenum cofactor guanylyltransferase MobA n=1 Tax=Cognatishimia sp. F0-27 TaxID=2816855 RepID=UPI001D0CD02F|nr:molybdenum cofactor guanylyltransferase MobA [Cognatishimia sp. F0-27]MCC1494189.1 molybdenum cofactor guanylyltransferase MobA [Cognatishimia sp. F0-27]
MTRPLGVILAGGLATRMGGGDKTLLALGGKPLLAHVMARLGPQVAGMALNANGDPSRFARHGLPVLGDSIDGFVGPLAGVLAGLDWAAGLGADRIVTVAGDTPFFPADLVDRLEAVSAGQVHPLVLAATPRGDQITKSMSRSGAIRHPTFGLWPVALRNDLRAALADGLKKVVLWTDRHGGREALFEEPGDPFFNVNTPDDLRAAERMLAPPGAAR